MYRLECYRENLKISIRNSTPQRSSAQKQNFNTLLIRGEKKEPGHFGVSLFWGLHRLQLISYAFSDNPNTPSRDSTHIQCRGDNFLSFHKIRIRIR